MPEAVNASRSTFLPPEDSTSVAPGCQAPRAATATTPTSSSSSSIETHTPSFAPEGFLDPSPSAESARSPAALQREQQQRAAERSRDLKTLTTALAPGLAELASKFDAPGDVRLADLRWSKFKDALDGQAMAALLSRRPRAEVETLLREALAKAWPEARAADVSAAVATFARAIDEHLEAAAAFKLRDTIVAKLRGTAAELDALAGDAATLQALGRHLESSGTARASRGSSSSAWPTGWASRCRPSRGASTGRRSPHA